MKYSIAGVAGSQSSHAKIDLKSIDVAAIVDGPHCNPSLVAGKITADPAMTKMTTEWIVLDAPPGYAIISSDQTAYIEYKMHGRSIRTKTETWSGGGGIATFIFPNELVGGTLVCTSKLRWRDPTDGLTKETLASTCTWRVIGENPPKAEVKKILPDLELQVICYKESRFRQFDGSGLPLFGPPRGFGVMQIDTPPATDRQVFDWRNNVAAGVALYRKKKAEVARHFQNEIAANPGARKLTPLELKTALYQYYNGGFYYRWNAASKVWEKYGKTDYADSALAIEAAIKAGNPPSDWN